MPLCYHTFLHWIDKQARCVVCDEGFDYEYNPMFIGVFPREDLEASRVVVLVNSTVTADRMRPYAMEDYFYGGES